jgi:hypothetical protein
MTDLKLTRDEKKRLQKIDDAIGWRQFISVKEHFNKAGKLEAFATAPTAEEKQEQVRMLKHIFGRDGAFASVRNADLFFQVARRIGTDAELAPLLPDGKFDAKDAELLEKCEMKSLAALIKTKLGGQP